MLEHYLRLGGTEIANSARLQAYVDQLGSPLDSVTVCGCSSFDASLVGDEEYVSPEADGAPWFDPNVPDSADFLGLMVLSVTGLDTFPMTRTVTAAVAGGSAIGPARIQPRTITVTAVLLGLTCCGVDYGLQWLAQALQGCTGADCGGDDLTLYNCCPAGVEDPAQFAAEHRRTLRRVALLSGPEVTARVGDGCTTDGSGCGTGADILTVEFVLTAATPWMWTDPQPVLDVSVPTDDDTECITWCLHDPPATAPVCWEVSDGACPPGSLAAPVTDASCEVAWPVTEPGNGPCDKVCRLLPCTDPGSACGDPNCRTPTPPVPPPPDTCFCHALAVNTAYYELDLSARPVWFGAVPVITVDAGSQDLRHVTITFYERRPEYDGLTCEEIAEAERCSPAGVYEIAYVPTGGILTLDGQVGRATVDCSGAEESGLAGCGGTGESSSDVYGHDGGPLAFPLLDGPRYCVAVEADAIVKPAYNAMIAIALSGRER